MRGHQGQGHCASVGGPMREEVGRQTDNVSIVVRWVILVGIAQVGRFRCVLLQPGGPQEGRLSDVEEWSNECTCSSYFEDR